MIRDDERLTGARVDGSAVNVYDNGFGSLWLYQNYEAPTWIVRAQSFEEALETVYDEMRPVPEDEVHEAYGFDTRAEFDAAVRKLDGSGDYLELTDGFYYQSNASGTGIVFPGYHEALEELTPALAERLGVEIDKENDE